MRLAEANQALDAFLGQVSGLGDKLGPVLFQLPPSLAFDPQRVGSFFAGLRSRFEGIVVCEPRHSSWFTPQAHDLFMEFQISRVAADPPVGGTKTEPGGWSEVVYFRLHGSPRVYYSEYHPDQLEQLALRLIPMSTSHPETWCIFDNTASGSATVNALAPPGSAAEPRIDRNCGLRNAEWAAP